MLGKTIINLLSKFCITSLTLVLIAGNFIFSQIPVIPKPQKVILSEGNFSLSSLTEYDLSAEQDKTYFELLNSELKTTLGFELKAGKPKFSGNFISFSYGPELKPEEYNISIKEKSISVEYGKKGANHAISTLIQLFHHYKNEKGISKIPCMLIADMPAFKWRGMHLDVSRHFFSVEFIKKYIDLLSLYKMNSFHWHLTDDQGWRIEIKKYPKLTSVGAWRNGSMIGHYRDQKFDTITYGGFYTQKEIREVVEYASERNINVVPEIEMPGHSLAALSAYPEMACNDSVFSAAKSWGVFDDIYCTKDETFKFLENILEEVCTLFPSDYIHIGGDEAPKVRWKKCAKCQQSIKSEGLKNEDELQSYFIRRIEKFINSKGKKIIGWDEILEGGLAPNAAVMSWRGTEGGEHAAKLKHFVVMSPGSHCYFDHYQSTPEFEPIAIGGYTPIEKVYSYDPIPTSLTNEEREYILGAQANLWTEYITMNTSAEYMAVPRISALAEALWSKKENKNWKDFSLRLSDHFKLLDTKKINYSKAIYDVKYNLKKDSVSDFVNLDLSSSFEGKIFYTLDGNDPNINSKEYRQPIILDKNSQLKAALFYDDKKIGRTLEKKFFVSKCTGKKIVFKTIPSKYYNKTQGFGMVNGILESASGQKDWCTGWCNSDPHFMIEFDKEIELKKLVFYVLSDEKNKIYPPEEIKISLNDKEDHVNFSAKKTIKESGVMQIDIEIPLQKTKSIEIKMKNTLKKEDSWILVDEILAE
ncbi:MAG: beta-N-acetylhexosaminidase [Bacteroidota bacterium]|jgi:hexosaminidase